MSGPAEPASQTIQGQTIQGQTIQGQTIQGQTIQGQTIQGMMIDAGRVKPKLIESANVDGLVAAVLRLTMEVSALRDRLDIHEAIAERHGVGGEAEVEAFQADADLSAKRSDRRQRLIESLIHDLTAVA